MSVVGLLLKHSIHSIPKFYKGEEKNPTTNKPTNPKKQPTEKMEQDNEGYAEPDITKQVYSEATQQWSRWWHLVSFLSSHSPKGFI